MKLRIRGNSIRLRLLRSEVERFAAEGRISDETSFGPTRLKYSLVTSGAGESITAHFDDNEIQVTIPDSIASEWAESELVSLDAEQAIGNAETLAILIEKDFVCLDRKDDPDRDDAFPNPQITCE